MKRPGLAMLAAGALLLVGGGVAAAKSTSFSTKVVVDGSSGTANAATVIGHLESPKKQCLSGRTVMLYEELSNGSSKLVGTDHSSERGIWAAKGDLADAQDERAKVVRKTIGRRHHRQVCKAAALKFFVLF
jgi:hypothetical protein